MKRKSMVVIGMVIGCLMMGAGAAWAGGRHNGTVTFPFADIHDLFWLENTTCLGKLTLDAAKSSAASLADGQCGLTDGSVAGNWRLPTKSELISISGKTSKFLNVKTDQGYWASDATGSKTATVVSMPSGNTRDSLPRESFYLWLVRNSIARRSF